MRVGRRKPPDRSTPIAAAVRHRLVESPFERQSVLVDRGREEQDRAVAGRLQPASTAPLAASTNTPQALEAFRGGGRRSFVFPAQKSPKTGAKTHVSGLYSFTILFAAHLTMGLLDRQESVRLVNFKPIFVDSQSPDFCVKRRPWNSELASRTTWPGDTARTFCQCSLNHLLFLRL
jgi:hypothetical protein